MLYEMFYNFILSISFKNLFLGGIFIIPLSQYIFSGIHVSKFFF